MGLILKPIREALAATIHTNTGRKINAYWCTTMTPQFPSVTVEPHPDTYVDYWQSFGPDGTADAMLRLKLEVTGQDGPAVATQLDAMLSAGTGAPLSVIDAVMRNRTLGGLVADCVPLNARIPDELAGTAYVDVKLLLTKTNAEVG